MLATVPQLFMALVLAQLLNQRLRARTFWRMGVLLPNITSVAAVGIIFTLLFARDFGLVNWLLGQVGVEPIDWQEHRWSSWLAISIDGRLALDRLQRPDLPGRAAGGARGPLRGGRDRRRLAGPAVLAASPSRCSGPRSSSSPSISTIGGIQLFTEPLLFNSGANAITGGNTRQFQTLTMYLYEQAFAGQEFGYASSVAWVMFLLIAVVAGSTSLLLRRLRTAV